MTTAVRPAKRSSTEQEVVFMRNLKHTDVADMDPRKKIQWNFTEIS
jgi:hypothetical protein